jgi:hypothetical protein
MCRFTCVNANGPNGIQSLATYRLSCAFGPNGQSSYPLTLNGSAPSPSFQLTIQSNATSPAMLVRPQTQINPIWAARFAVLPIPVIILFGCARKLGRRRTNVAGCIGLLLVLTIIGNSQATVSVGLQVSQ